MYRAILKRDHNRSRIAFRQPVESATSTRAHVVTLTLIAMRVSSRSLLFIGVQALAAALLIGACGGDTKPSAQSAGHAPDSGRARSAVAAQNLGVLPPFLLGVWSREYITRRGAQGDSLTVRYLQAVGPFGDVRIPPDRTWNATATSFAELTDAQLRGLARQKGFTGHTTFDGSVVTWHHELDFQPDTSRDASHVSREDDAHIMETGLDSSFVERYRRLSTGDDRFLALRVERNGRIDRVLIVVGDWFYFARNRAADLPPAESFDALIAARKPTRAQLINWLDCELAAGRIAGGSIPWEIQQSTLPWREGRHLDFVDAIRADSSGTLVFPSPTAGESWKVTEQFVKPAALSLLFRAMH